MYEEGIFYTDKDEEQMLEKNKNPIKQNFIEIQDHIMELKCMVDILLMAIDNEFNPPNLQNIEIYLSVLKEQIILHRQKLEVFFNSLAIPDEKGKLISLAYVKFKD